MAILEAVFELLLTIANLVMELTTNAKSKWGNGVFWCACAVSMMLLILSIALFLSSQ